MAARAHGDKSRCQSTADQGPSRIVAQRSLVFRDLCRIGGSVGKEKNAYLYNELIMHPLIFFFLRLLLRNLKIIKWTDFFIK